MGPPFLLYVSVRGLFLKMLSLYPAAQSPTESQTLFL